MLIIRSVVPTDAKFCAAAEKFDREKRSFGDEGLGRTPGMR
jgi:hypothetical protein